MVVKKKSVFVARDALGVRPLFKIKKGNAYGFSSEMKMVVDLKPDTIVPFLPGTFSLFKLQLKDFSKKQWIWGPVFENKKFTTINNCIDCIFLVIQKVIFV